MAVSVFRLGEPTRRKEPKDKTGSAQESHLRASLASMVSYSFDTNNMNINTADDMSRQDSRCEDEYAIYQQCMNLIITPPLSPQRSEDGDDSLSLYSSISPVCQDRLHYSDVMPTDELFHKDYKSNVVIQDCMWSGVGSDGVNNKRKRNVSLSELNMVTASTSCVDPTTFTAYPRQQNQVEHNYSLATPEPMRVPKLHGGDCTPNTTDDSESEEDVIDVVTIDTRAHSSTKSYSSSNGNVYVRQNLREAAHSLASHPYSRPKCMSDHDFIHPNKKSKKHFSSQHSFVSSHSSSDNEEYDGKRSAHNVMERQRRNELKNSLHGLRDSLPSLETHERAPKVVILAHAAQYLLDLQGEERKLAEDHSKLKVRNNRLKEKLSYLKSLSDLF